MSLASRRRMMLKDNASQNVNETILTSNYDPNGEKFAFANEWDVDGDTLYAEWIDRKVNFLGNFLSLMGVNSPNEVSELGKYKGTKIHCYNNATREGHEGELVLAFMPSGERGFIMLNGGVNKLMLNSNGIYINGVHMETTVNEIFNALSTKPYIAVGSTEGTNRSYDHYNKISVIHEKYTGEQMAEFTAV